MLLSALALMTSRVTGSSLRSIGRDERAVFVAEVTSRPSISQT